MNWLKIFEAYLAAHACAESLLQAQAVGRLSEEDAEARSYVKHFHDEATEKLELLAARMGYRLEPIDAADENAKERVALRQAVAATHKLLNEQGMRFAAMDQNPMGVRDLVGLAYRRSCHATGETEGDAA